MVCFVAQSGNLNIAGLGNSPVCDLFNNIVAAWGQEEISEINEGSGGDFTLPAKDGLVAQKYQLDWGAESSPAMANYTA